MKQTVTVELTYPQLRLIWESVLVMRAVHLVEGDAKEAQDIVDKVRALWLER